MKKKYLVPPATAERQATASDPRTSAWVSANAGSGKTHVLAQRVIRLLLEGTDPSKILCLTYTRAAAANMSNRVFGNLSRWTMLGDSELETEIAAIDGDRPNPGKLRRARRLFAQALETPGGLKIQTIHAFCESVLHQFPLEANIAAHFEMLDPLMEETLFAVARREMVTGAAAENPALAEAFAAVLERAGEHGLDVLLKEIVSRRDGLRAFIDAAGHDDPPYALLFEEFGFGSGDTAEGVASAIWPDTYFDAALADRYRQQAIQAGKSTAQSFAESLEGACGEKEPQDRLRCLCDVFLVEKKGEGFQPRSIRNIASKGVGEHFPDFTAEFERMALAVQKTVDRHALFRMLEGTRAALTVADWLLDRYERLKTGRGFLDFNDLITRTVRLLSRQDAGPWVQYKLDKGIDHILLDEAQDTSPDQWNVVKRLAEEFFAGLGARDNVHRTVFAVGDEKQSIYSFQGAAPESFADTGSEFSLRISAANASFEKVKLTLSFRSTNDILHAVDRVFSGDAARRGISHDPDPVRHEAIRFDAPGYVEIWPSLAPDTVEEPDDWREPIDHAHAPAVRLAEQVAATIQRWIGDGEVIEGTGRRVTAGDIMILVRKRDRFVHALARNLKHRNVPVAGADRLRLPGHIAIKDLIALGRFLIQPEDDLSLAAVLRSPIFALDGDRLFTLAGERAESVSLIQSLRRNGESDPAFADIARQLALWAGEAAARPVFEFYSAVLGRDGVRRRMIARLGNEAGDILDEFLNFCLAEERTGLPGMESFLATLESAGPEIKREMDQSRNEVRIMTVHAAKGLEAPVVFLVDSGAAPFSEQHLPRFLSFEPEGALREAGVKGWLWRSTKQVANGFSKEASQRIKERADDEYRRLLYVGMTRAEDRLIVCGYHGKRAQGEATWHSIVSRALVGAERSEERPHPAGGDSTVHRFRVTDLGEPVVAQPEETRPAASVPARLFDRLPPSEALPRPLSPSGASVLIEETSEQMVSGRSPVLDPDVEPGFAIARGLVLHKLLQMLPMLPEQDRQAAASRYIARAAPGWPQAEREAALASVFAILAAPGFAPIFSPASRAEVSIMGSLTIRGRQRSVSGKIDRLAVTDNEVLIVDYKTNRPAPADAGQVPPAYLAQLALYRALLQPLYPGKAVSAGLLFTEVPRLIALPAALMDETLVRLTKA